MLIARKNKDTGEIEYTGCTDVDEELSLESSNPVQNKVVTSKFSEVSEEINALKKSVSDGKKAVADALTGQGVTTATDATFATMAENVGTVGTNKYNAGKTDYNPTDATLGNDGVLTVKNSAGTTRLTKTFTNSYNKGVTDADARVLKTNASYKQGYIDGGNGTSGEKHGASIVVTLGSGVATGNVLYLYLGSTVVQQVTMSSSSHTFKDIFTKGTYTVKYSGCIDVPITISADHILDKTSFSASMIIGLNFTVYGAKNDNITIKNSSGTTVANVVFASGQTSKTVSITVLPGNYTFTSSVSKDTTNGTSAYSKTVYISSGTTRVNVYPDGAIYWYGNEIYTFSIYKQDGFSSANGTKNSNNITLSYSYDSSGCYTILARTNGAVNFDGYSKICALCPGGRIFADTDSWTTVISKPFEYIPIYLNTTDSVTKKNISYSGSLYVYSVILQGTSILHALWLE